MRRKGYLLADTQKIYPPGGVEIKLHRGGSAVKTPDCLSGLVSIGGDPTRSLLLGGTTPVGCHILSISEPDSSKNFWFLPHSVHHAAFGSHVKALRLLGSFRFWSLLPIDIVKGLVYTLHMVGMVSVISKAWEFPR